MIGQCSIGDENAVECYNDVSIPWPRRAKKKFTVAVEGNIGCGKSTFLNYFMKSSNTEVLMEPVNSWKSVQGHNTLELMYKDSQRWSLTFQSYVQLTMLQNHVKKQRKAVKMMERSIYSAKYCFVENLYKNGMMPGVDYAVLSEWFAWMQKSCNIGVDLIVYLRATPETCMDRIRQRNRKEESLVPLEYLESLHELHEDWLIHQTKFPVPAPVLVLEADKGLSDLQLDFETRREEILCGNV
ncbi:hypothetical protein CAPTEDRAFT_178371 [Capitella teleta]|uniref:Deoxynucleoside kinase domain-containing protein n=1 Tax=Capitella teleta TaxID=283909 RepID=R7VFJ5_CAPTE|nr:hypothetical protein CAPTEDRAFT_178371 [Capitella teleta]|eukprot:ELU17389.1 hypothetical protein CAPTEDRAFT_178371 [Capitella teleta]